MLWFWSASRSLLQRPSMHASPTLHCELRVQLSPAPAGLAVHPAIDPKQTVSHHAHRETARTRTSLSEHDENRAFLTVPGSYAEDSVGIAPPPGVGGLSLPWSTSAVLGRASACETAPSRLGFLKQDVEIRANF